MSEDRDVQWYRQAMRQLYKDAGKPLESELIAQARRLRRVTLDDSTLNDWLKGLGDEEGDDAVQIVVPRDREKFGTLVGLLQERANRNPGRKQSKVDFEQLRANAESARRRGRRKRERDSRTQEVTPVAGVGHPLEQITDPFALEVHRAIDIDLPAGADDLDPLPAYVERAHDGDLERVVQRAAGGNSGVAVLIGTAASGKTRACWESLQNLSAGWRLWRPADPATAWEQLVEVTSRTVIWLDDTNDGYLYTPASDSGEKLARGLFDLVHDSGRAPVLVLDTMWPDTWAALTTQPARDVDDRRHQRALTLLTGHGIPVPSAFDNDDDRAALAAKAAEDPRLALAVAEAEDDEITQYLAGVPVLMERYRTALEGARAMIDAAMDARRLEHPQALPLGFLEAAARAYLSDRQWHRLAREENWLQRALAYAEADCRGAGGLLVPIDPRQGVPRHSAHYRLADPLDQQVRPLADAVKQDERRCREYVLIPAAFWEAAVQQVSDPIGLLMMAHAAEKRWLLRHAARLYSKAGAAGLGFAYARLGKLLDDAREFKGAKVFEARAAEVAGPREESELARLGVLDAFDPLWLFELDELRSDRVWELEAAGRHDEAEEFAREEANGGHPEAMGTLIGLRDQADYTTEHGRMSEIAIYYRDQLLRPGPGGPMWRRVRRYGLEADGSVSAPWRWETLG